MLECMEKISDWLTWLDRLTDSDFRNFSLMHSQIEEVSQCCAVWRPKVFIIFWYHLFFFLTLYLLFFIVQFGAICKTQPTILFLNVKRKQSDMHLDVVFLYRSAIKCETSTSPFIIIVKQNEITKFLFTTDISNSFPFAIKSNYLILSFCEYDFCSCIKIKLFWRQTINKLFLLLPSGHLMTQIRILSLIYHLL